MKIFFIIQNIIKVNVTSSFTGGGKVDSFFPPHFIHHIFPLKQWPPFNFQCILFIRVCCFLSWGPGRQYVQFLPRSYFCLSFHPHTGLHKVQRPEREKGFVHFFLFLYVFSPASLRLSGWIDVRTTVPQGGRVENRICSLQMQRGKKVGERDGWTDRWMEAGVWGCIWCEALQRRVRESKPTTTWCHVPRQPQGIHPSACFWKTPSSCCFISSHVFFFLFSFSQFFFSFFILACTAQETLSCEQYLLQKLSLVMCFYFSPMSTSVY